jgi:curved DNA-binding protein
MSLTDYYEVLQISPNAEPDTIHRVFRLLAMRFHPDNPETGNNQRFLELNRAYEVLSDPDQRREYDELFLQQKEEPMAVFWLKDFTEGTEGEANRRMGILCLLYHKRRVNPEEPGTCGSACGSCRRRSLSGLTRTANTKLPARGPNTRKATLRSRNTCRDC